MNAIPLYDPHPGTIRISGGTDCRKAAKCALYFLKRGITDVDFFYIGANAGQQAMKAMGIMRNFLEEATEGKCTVLFQPNRVQTNVKDAEQPGVVIVKDAVYWRAYIIRASELQNILRNYGYNESINLAEHSATDGLH